ncbi:MAG: methyltransferase domain-containing protein [Candidatus Dactylopiibacterium sp.]|nr:methyltransferase domain-containing protein [Candidatus Dactylopiibacterium sp.]
MSHSCLGEWFESPRGRYLLAWEHARFDERVADIFGFNAAQIGLCGHDFLRANRMALRLRCTDRRDTALLTADLLAEAEELPFASQSLDLVVLPHVLEFVSHPHQVLREVERVLLPEGHVLITGFNPVSLWGLRRSLAGHMGVLPWTGQYLGVPRLKDWLSLLGFEHRGVTSGCFAPPVASEEWLRRWSFMEVAGAHCWPFGGAVYMLHAVRRLPGMRLMLMPAWREQRARRKAMVPAAHRHGR